MNTNECTYPDCNCEAIAGLVDCPIEKHLWDERGGTPRTPSSGEGKGQGEQKDEGEINRSTNLALAKQLNDEIKLTEALQERIEELEAEMKRRDEWIEKYEKQVEAEIQQLEAENKALSSQQQEGETQVKYEICGGCGAKHPSKRCINCFHNFMPEGLAYRNIESLQHHIRSLQQQISVLQERVKDFAKLASDRFAECVEYQETIEALTSQLSTQQKEQK
jgi:uncharacterized phage infection (PIP) family protein YhgE